MEVKLLNGNVNGGWEIEFLRLDDYHATEFDTRHPSKKLPSCHLRKLQCGHAGGHVPITSDDIVVYATGERYTSEVLSTTRYELPAGVTIVALLITSTGELFDLSLCLERSIGIRERINLANRIEMALGSLGWFIPRHIRTVGYI